MKKKKRINFQNKLIGDMQSFFFFWCLFIFFYVIND
jgi:hypothetical protein